MMDHTFSAGFGKSEIVFPQELFPVEGFCGIHDNPGARLMVLRAADEQWAVASLELVNLPAKGIDKCKEIIAAATNTKPEHIWIHVTHAISTMHEPGPKGPPDRRPPATTEDKAKQALFFGAIEKAVREASQQAANMTAARFGWGEGTCLVNCNRDMLTPHGWWTGLNPEGLSNKTMTVLRVENKNGQPLGFLVSYGIKPCAVDNAGMADNTRLISADVSGVCSKKLEKHFGVPALFCVSAAADQVPREQAMLDEVDENGQAHHRDYGVECGMEIMERLGSEMGRDAISIADSIYCDQSAADIAWGNIAFEWPCKFGRPSGPSLEPKPIRPEDPRTVTAELFALGDTVFVAEKPEVNCQTELELKAGSPYSRTILMCMVNGDMKYMPDRSAYQRNTFESQSAILREGAAEEFVQRVVQELNAMKN